MVNGDQKLGLIQPEILRQKVPRKLDRLLLEVIPKTEISQHLKEGVVPRSVAHIVQIIMLATGAHAFLAGGGPTVIARLDPGEKVLELHHPRVGEHQRRIIAWHKR